MRKKGLANKNIFVYVAQKSGNKFAGCSAPNGDGLKEWLHEMAKVGASIKPIYSREEYLKWCKTVS